MKRDNLQLGPWTTTLHHSSSLELSAFWRRRLNRLGSLAATRARMSWASAAALCIVASMLAMMPRLQLDALARAEEQAAQPAAVPAKPQAAEKEPFTATFSNGVKVQLIGLSENPSKGKPWWAPDGTALGAAPYARVPALMHAEGGPAREICWRWINLPEDPDVETGWMTEPHYSGAGGGRAFDASGKQMDDTIAWAVSFAQSRETFTLRFSVSVRATPWATVFTNDGRNTGAMASTIDGVRQGAIFGERRADKGGTSITVTHQIPGKAVRLVAVDNDGLLDLSASTGGAGALGFSQTTYHFASLSPDKIQRFELQSQKRRFETIEFRNVSLHSEKQTNVEIVRVAVDNPHQGPADGSNVATHSAGKQPPGEKSNSTSVHVAQQRYRQSLKLLESLTKEHGYRLEQGQSIKHLPPPFSKAREEYWSLSSSPTMYGVTGAQSPVDDEPPQHGFMLLHWTGNDLQSKSFHFSEPTLRQILDSVFNLKLQDIEGDLELLTLKVPGDWVVGWDPQKDHAASPEEIEALERILRDELKTPMRLTLHDVDRAVYVAKGSYKFTPVAGPDGKVQQVNARVAERADGDFQIPLRRSNIAAQVVTYQEFLHAIGEVILTPIVDEATTRPKKESVFMRYHGDVPKDYLARFDEAQVNELLVSMTKQTGLTFSKETRPVKTLLFERDAAR